MNQRLKRLLIFGGTAFIWLFFLNDGNAQNIRAAVSPERAKENFDFNWQFHKGDIAMKRVIQAGGQGGLTDINVKIITNPIQL